MASPCSHSKPNLPVFIEYKHDKQRAKQKTPICGPLELFKFSTHNERITLAMGCLASMAHGIAAPLLVLVLGKTTVMISEMKYREKYIHIMQKLFNSTRVDRLSPTLVFYIRSIFPHFHTNQIDIVEETTYYARLYAGLALVVLIVGYFQTILFVVVAERQTIRIKGFVFKSILQQEMAWFDAMNANELVSKIIDNAIIVHGGFGERLGFLLQMLSMTVCGFAIALYKNWKICLIVLSVWPFILLISVAHSKLSTQLTVGEVSSYAEAGGVAEEAFNAIRMVRAFGGEAKECRRYTACLTSSRSYGVRRGAACGAAFGLIWFLHYNSYAAAFWYGGKQIREQKDFSVESFVSSFFNVVMSGMSLATIITRLEDFNNARISAAFLFSLIDRKENASSHRSNASRIRLDTRRLPLIMPNMNAKIEFTNVYFAYPTRPQIDVLNNFSLTIHAGQSVAVVGPSGCGKSTLIKLIQRFYDVSEGQITVDNRPLNRADIHWWRSNLGVVSQDPNLFDCSILQNFLYARADTTMREIEQVCARVNLDGFIKSLPDGYHTRIGARGAKLSGGQKQRIAIARALLHNPKVLLLDEATSALDSHNQTSVQSALEQAQLGRTTLTITHNLQTVRNADVIAVMLNGRIVEVGSHDQLVLQKHVYYNMLLKQTNLFESTQTYCSESVVSESEDCAALNETLIFPSVASLKTKREPDEQNDSENESETDRAGALSNNGRNSLINGREQPSHKNLFVKELWRSFKSSNFRRLLRINYPESPFLFIGCLAAFVNGALNPFISHVLGNFLPVLENPDLAYQKQQVDHYANVFILFSFISAASNICQYASLAKSGEELTMRCRALMFKAIIRQKIAWFDEARNHVSILTHRLSSDAAEIHAATGVQISVVLMAVSGVGMGVLLAFVYQWKLALVELIFVPFFVLSGVFQMKIQSGCSETDTKALQSSKKILTESVEQISTVYSFNMQNTLVEAYRRKLLQPYDSLIKRGQILAICYGVLQALLYCCFSAIFYYSGFLIRDKSATMEDIFTVLGSLMFGSIYLGQATAFAPDMSKANSSAQYMFELIDRQTKSSTGKIRNEIDSKSCTCRRKRRHSKPHSTTSSCCQSSGTRFERTNAPHTADLVQFERVQFSYPARSTAAILRGLNLAVRRRETVALIGSSGSGKSTIINLLLKFYEIDRGNLIYDGAPISSWRTTELRNQMSIVFQEASLLSMSIFENIAYGDNSRAVSQNEVELAAHKARIHEFICSLPEGYQTRIGLRGALLSGGQRQRIAIARALLKNPKLLILDEATSALDIDNEKHINNSLEEARADRCCIIITHRIESVRHVERICVLHNGQIVEQGSHSQLMERQNGLYAHFYRAQDSTPSFGAFATTVETT